MKEPSSSPPPVSNLLLAEYADPAAEPVFRFIYAGDQRIAMYDKLGRLHFYLNDHLGSARVVIDSAGAVKDRMEYYAYGDNLSHSIATSQSHRYTGQELDDDGGFQVYYYGQRYYDDNNGFFLSIDPARGKDPAWSPYVYVRDNPLGFVDPSGAGAEDTPESKRMAQHNDELKSRPGGEGTGWMLVEAEQKAEPVVQEVKKGAVRTAKAAKTPAGLAAIGCYVAGVATLEYPPVSASLFGAGDALSAAAFASQAVETALYPTPENRTSLAIEVAVSLLARSAGRLKPGTIIGQSGGVVTTFTDKGARGAYGVTAVGATAAALLMTSDEGSPAQYHDSHQADDPRMYMKNMP